MIGFLQDCWKTTVNKSLHTFKIIIHKCAEFQFGIILFSTVICFIGCFNKVVSLGRADVFVAGDGLHVVSVAAVAVADSVRRLLPLAARRVVNSARARPPDRRIIVLFHATTPRAPVGPRCWKHHYNCWFIMKQLEEGGFFQFTEMNTRGNFSSWLQRWEISAQILRNFREWISKSLF